jgi:hypothetical protein
MINCGINPQEILVVIGGCDENYEDFKYAGLFNHLNVKFDAIDQTTFYAMKKNPNIFNEEYYYYMHDTSKVGLNFNSMIKNLFDFVKQKELNTMKNTSFYSANMGFYKKDFILKTLSEMDCYTKNEEFLLDEEESLENKKSVSYDLEDKIFLYDQQLSNGLYYTISNDIPICSEKKQDIYNTGNERMVFYHERIDLYKFAGNSSSHRLGCKI